MTPAHLIARVKESVDLAALVGEYVQPLRRAGTRMVGRCCFHEEKTASFGVHDEGYYMCFGCGAKGDAFAFLMAIEGIPFHQALRRLADRAGISLDAKPISRQAQRWAQEEAAACRWYWARYRARQMAAIHAAIEGPESWLDALGAPLRWVDGLSVEQRFQAFRARCTERDRQQWRAETAEAREFAEAWMRLAA